MEEVEQLKILVIEDHPIVRDGCQRIFNRRTDIEMIEASSATDGLALNKSFRPDVIVLDIGLPDASGFDILPKLIAENNKAAIIVLSMYGTQSFVTSALEKGAVGFITKNDEPNSLLQAIERVRNGEIYLGQAVAQTLAMNNLAPSSDPLRGLSPREGQIIALLGEGRSLTEISVELNLGYKTVANGVTLIKQKLNIGTTTALVKFAVEHNLKTMSPG
ncbi:DNA-binding response regulator [Methylovirgula ligni]|uniref:LuxR family two component transcriptional regulator n=1 Tax=Methylovirgula ligni TaxID=569860 RepID=A0A3D9YVT4_9HYPH|nr:response regulator transcription factor [Methylovirgula ligni]QAY96438.1 DNA-binding response regulator [Methylovirgula ligni]REF85831.1 LuxR family two component transcriptional regulator [Methylovirgula ligni]